MSSQPECVYIYIYILYIYIYKEKSATAAFVLFMMQNMRACVRFFRKRQKRTKYLKIWAKVDII